MSTYVLEWHAKRVYLSVMLKGQFLCYAKMISLFVMLKGSTYVVLKG